MRQMARALIDEQRVPASDILFVNFEDPRFRVLEVSLLDNIFETYRSTLHPYGRPFVFLDEVQEVAGWEKWVRTMHELGKATLVVSGSNAHLMSRELATALTGRHLDHKVFPLSFEEFLHFRKVPPYHETAIPPSEHEMQEFLREYMEFGGFPEVVERAQKKELLLTYANDSIEHDLIERYRIRKGEKLRELAHWYFSNVAELISYTRVAKWLHISSDTAEKFSRYLEDSYLFFFMRRFSFKVREQERSPRKLYAIDSGLAHAVGFEFSENLGKHAENIVFLELMRRRADDPSMQCFYWKDERHREVDFLIQEGRTVRTLLQVVWNFENPETRERELKSLRKAMEAFPNAAPLLITAEYEGKEIVGNARAQCVPLWKWLLNL